MVDNGSKNKGLVCSNEVVALVCVVKKAELKGETLDILVCLMTGTFTGSVVRNMYS